MILVCKSAHTTKDMIMNLYIIKEHAFIYIYTLKLYIYNIYI